MQRAASKPSRCNCRQALRMPQTWSVSLNTPAYLDLRGRYGCERASTGGPRPGAWRRSRIKLTGQSAEARRSARPRTCHGVRRSSFEGRSNSALGDISRRLSQYLVRLAKLSSRPCYSAVLLVCDFETVGQGFSARTVPPKQIGQIEFTKASKVGRDRNETVPIGTPFRPI